jgi:membrane protease YdiL (CAAX protease family)
LLINNTEPRASRSAPRFFALVIVLNVPFVVFGSASLGLPVNLPVASLAAVCPLLAALILVATLEGRAAVMVFLRRIVGRPIRPAIWCLPVFLLTPGVLLLSLVALHLLGRSLPTPDISIPVAVLLFALFLVAAIGEEAGWSGYVIDPLQRRWGALPASVALGVVWGALHLVGWSVQTHHGLAWTAGMWGQTVAYRVLMVWIYNNTGKNVLTAVLLHAMMNITSLLFHDLFDPVVVATIATAAAVITTILWGPATLARYRYQPTSSQQQPPSPGSSRS